MAQGYLVELILNGTYQLVVYADGNNLLGNTRNTANKYKAESLIVISKEVSMELKTEKSMYMCVSSPKWGTN
jgi:transcriptional antiterminator Rof (Rho-off)